MDLRLERTPQTSGKTDDRFDPGQPDQPDQSGHSTCAAPKAGGKTYGIAKKATIVAVKVRLERTDIGSILDRACTRFCIGIGT